MDNVLNALRHMAEHGGNWYFDRLSGSWLLNLSYSRAYVNDYGSVGFSQQEMQDFLKHYEQLVSNPPVTYIQMAFKEMREFNVEDTYNHLL